MNKKTIIISVVVLLAVGFIVATQLYKSQQTKEAEAYTKNNLEYLERDYSPRKGNKNAKVTIVEFFDPACEACKAFHPLVTDILNAYPDKVQVVMRYAPFHQGSDYIVALLEGAKEQGKFWETLEAAYASQDIWASHGNPQPKKLWMQLGNVGLDLTEVQNSMQSEKTTQHINQDISDLKQMKVSKTPSFFVNGKPLTTFGYDDLKNLVKNEISIQY